MDGEPSAPSKSMTTLERCCSPAKTMDTLNHSRSGMTCEHSTASRGVAWWMSSLAASRAKTLAHQAPHAPASTEIEAGCGGRWQESLAKFDHLTSSWKIAQLSLLEGLDVFWESWPKWGIMQNGECWELAALVEHNEESECGYWPPPLASDFRNRGSRCGKGQWNLSHILHKHGRLDLQLSPQFREWLMSWPIGWTGLQPLETDKWQQWCRSFGLYSHPKAKPAIEGANND